MSLTKATYSMIQGAAVNVLDYGAIGNNSTDCTSAFQAALATGKPVFIPAGEYVISGKLEVPNNGFLYGDGTYKSVLKCDNSTYTGVFLAVYGRAQIQNFSLQGTGEKEGTGIRFQASDGEYNFTGHSAAYSVAVYGFNIGVDINNFFDLLLERVDSSYNTIGVRTLPSYSPSTDSGYYTTLTFFKCYFGFNDKQGYIASSTINGQITHFLDSVIESNGAAGGINGQIEITRCFLVQFTSCYSENQVLSTIPWLWLSDVSECVIENQWGPTSSTLGIDIGEYTGKLAIINSACGALKGATSGALGQSIYALNSNIGTKTIADTVQQHYIQTTVGGAYQRNTWLGTRLSIIGDLTNTSAIQEFRCYRTTVSATINANTTVALVSGQYAANLFVGEDAVGTAQLQGVGHEGLILTVTPNTSGPNFDVYFNVYATNTTGSPITLTSEKLCVMFFKSAPMDF